MFDFNEWYTSLEPIEKEEFLADYVAHKARKNLWPDQYVSNVTGKTYEPHNAEEEDFVYNDSPRYRLLKGGEGAGKSVAGVIKDLNRVRRGMNVIVLSPDLPHFKKSLWPVLLEWTPWQCTILSHQKLYTKPGWQPSGTFEVWFFNELGTYSKFVCGGIAEADVLSWEGPNVSACHFDEARRHSTPEALKVLDGRARIVGPNGEPPQVYLTTTPRKHWMFEYFGPLKDEDEYKDFKNDSAVSTVRTYENESNLSAGFHLDRAKTLNASEARIKLDAEWEDEGDIEKFVNIVWWDRCEENLPPLTPFEPVVLAVDASKGGETNTADTFSLVLISRNPRDTKLVAVRYVQIYKPTPGKLFDFKEPKAEIKRLCEAYSVVEVAYDPAELHDMAMTMKQEGIAKFRAFNPHEESRKADGRLQRLILERRITHDGNRELRQHIDNADCKKHDRGVKLIKRHQSLKIDGAKCVSMGADRSLYYNL